MCGEVRGDETLDSFFVVGDNPVQHDRVEDGSLVRWERIYLN